MARPTARASGTNSSRAAPCMKKDGTNTARMHSMASSRGTAVSVFPSRTARARLSVRPIWVWMFSTSTVDSSTRMPMDRASPPRVIRLSVWPVIHRARTLLSTASGMFNTTTMTARQSRRNSSTMRPVRTAPSAPSATTPRTAFRTSGDWSKANSMPTPSAESRIRGSASRRFRTTSRVPASAFLLTIMYTLRRPSTREYPVVMSAASVSVATSRRNTGRSPVLTGRVPSSAIGFAPAMTFEVTRKLRSPTRRLPLGMTAFPSPTACVTCSRVRFWLRNLSASTLTTMARWLPPNAGGLVSPGTPVNSGRTRRVAMSWISLMLLVSLDSTR